MSINTLHAQERDKSITVSMRIDFVSWGKDLSGLEVREGKSGSPVSALAFRYSKSLEYKGSQFFALTFGEISDEESKNIAEALEEWRNSEEAEGDVLEDAKFLTKTGLEAEQGEIPKALAQARKKAPKLAVLVKLPATSDRVTILLAPGPDHSLISHVLDDNPDQQPLGMVRVHNFSPHPISLTSAGKTEILQPGKNFLAPTPDKSFAYELAYQIDGAWKIQENNLVSVSPNEQMRMLVLRSGSSFFSSSDGSRGGFMQTALLRRNAK